MTKRKQTASQAARITGFQVWVVKNPHQTGTLRWQDLMFSRDWRWLGNELTNSHGAAGICPEFYITRSAARRDAKLRVAAEEYRREHDRVYRDMLRKARDG